VKHYLLLTAKMFRPIHKYHDREISEWRQPNYRRRLKPLTCIDFTC